ncbi:hypothetical protein BEL01nite_07460 [Bradyrhizobium elkanii]|nr:hypothetical protein BEL01nite_07460 [Bradyrhizobium elkanii]
MRIATYREGVGAGRVGKHAHADRIEAVHGVGVTHDDRTIAGCAVGISDCKGVLAIRSGASADGGSIGARSVGAATESSAACGCCGGIGTIGGVAQNPVADGNLRERCLRDHDSGYRQHRADRPTDSERPKPHPFPLHAKRPVRLSQHRQQPAPQRSATRIA